MRNYDYYTAMFNCHVNDALEKTIEKFKEIWGESKYQKIIKPYIDKGVMSIFHNTPNKYLKFFVFYNQRMVNS